VSIASARTRRRLAPALVLLAVACAKEPAAKAPPASVDTAHASAAPASDPVGLVPLPEDKTSTELRDYRITLPAIQRWARAQNAITAALKDHPDALRQHAAPPATLDAMVARMDSIPEIHGALARSGMTAHDLVLTMIALNQAVGLYQRRTTKAPLPPGLTPAMMANADFVGQNLAAVQQVLGSITR
jgi:hypothetical protein